MFIFILLISQNVYANWKINNPYQVFLPAYQLQSNDFTKHRIAHLFVNMMKMVLIMNL